MPAGRLIEDDALAGLPVGSIAGRETVELVGRDREAGVLHPERVEQAFLQDNFERLAGGARDERAKQVRAGVVHPALARLVRQRERAEPPQPLVLPRRGLRRGGALAELELVHGEVDRAEASGGEVEPEAEAEGEQIAQGDRAVGGHGLIERAVEAGHHLAVRQLRQEALDRVVEAEQALLDQDHRQSGADRLGEGGDAEDGVALERAALVGLLADHIDVDFAAPLDQRDQPGHAIRADVAGHDLVHSLQPRPRELFLAHACSFMRCVSPIGEWVSA